MQKALQDDGNALGWKTVKEIEDPEDYHLREGNWLIAPVCDIDTGDFHYYYKRGTEYWEHKPGMYPIRKWDMITDPREDEFFKEEYGTFLGFYEVGPN